MRFGCLTVLFALVVAAQSRTIRKDDNIPVEVVYEEKQGVKNLEEKVQLSEQHLKTAQEEVKEKEQTSGNPNGVKNLQEKVQLSPEELDQVLKHLPLDNLKSQQDEDSKIALRSEIPVEKVDSSEKESSLFYLKKFEEIIFASLAAVKKNFEASPENIKKPSEEEWRSLNKTVEDLIKNEYQKVGALKQDAEKPPPNNQNFFQTFLTSFQNATNNWVSNLQNNNRPVNGSGDEQVNQPVWQNFVNAFQGTINQVTAAINNVQSSTPGTVLGDTGTGASTQPPNIFNNIFNSVNSFLGGQNPQNNNKNQSDTGTGTGPNQPPNIIQGAVNQFNQFVSNIRPTTSKPAGSQGDEGSTPASNQNPIGQIFQNFQQQVGSAINSVTNFGQTTSKPGSEDTGTGSTQGPNFIQSIGQAFQNVNPFRPPQQGTGNNPISTGIEAVNNQVQQLVNPASGEKPVAEKPSEDGKKPSESNDKPVEGTKPDEKPDESHGTVEEAKPIKDEIKPQATKEKAEIMETME